jgi:hypothetical protein
MAHLLSDLANYFRLDEINIDNWTFKLYYNVSMVKAKTKAKAIFCVFFSLQYFEKKLKMYVFIIMDLRKTFQQLEVSGGGIRIQNYIHFC